MATWTYALWFRLCLALGGVVALASLTWADDPGWIGWFEMAGGLLGPFMVLEAIVSRAVVTTHGLEVRNSVGVVRRADYEQMQAFEVGPGSTFTVKLIDGGRMVVPRYLSRPTEVLASLESQLATRGIEVDRLWEGRQR